MILRPFFARRFSLNDRDSESRRRCRLFIVGMPRSGTTLTEQIVSSHPEVTGAGELPLIGQVARKIGFDRSDLTPYRHQVISMTRGQSHELAQEYLASVRKKFPNSRHVADKLPLNFEHLGLIAILFPSARIIHCRREPIDTCVSCFMQALNRSHAYSTDLTTLGLYYREYHGLMEHWRQSLPLPIHEVRYEKLVANQESETRALISFLGLPWDDACLKYFETSRAVRTLSRWQVRQPIYSSSVERWRHYAGHLQPLIAALGDLAPAGRSSSRNPESSGGGSLHDR